MTDAQHNHNERSALRRHHAEDLQSIAKALGIDDDKVQTHELVAQILGLKQERDRFRDAVARNQWQYHEQINLRAKDQKELAQILGLDPFDPQNTIPALHRAVQLAVEDARSWRQSQRKR